MALPRTIDQLWVAEKPSVQRQIEVALGGQVKNRDSSRKDGYTHTIVDGKNVVITSVFGHMIAMDPPRAYDCYKRHGQHAKETGNYDRFLMLPWLPDELRYSSMPEIRDGKIVTRNGEPVESKRLTLICELAGYAKEIVNACDIDREGQLIFDEIFLHKLGRDPSSPEFKRVRLFSAEESDVKRACASLENNGDPLWLNLRYAAQARQIMDYLLGMNASMAFQQLIRQPKGSPPLGLGRVKIGILSLVNMRDQEIARFKPYDYYVPVVVLADGTELRWHGRPDSEGKSGFNERGQIVSKDVAEHIVHLINRGQTGRVTDSRKEKKAVHAPLPFSMGTLQITASKRHGLSLEQVRDAAQSLYEKHKAITYVGTDCQFLPESMHDRSREIIAQLAGAKGLVSGADELAAGADPARKSKAFNDEKVGEHFAITPTGKVPTGLDDAERLVYDTIVRRYLAQFYPPYEYYKTSLAAVFGQDEFRSSKNEMASRGWKAVEGGGQDDSDDPDDSPDEQHQSTIGERDHG